jgi:hypothetical protein
MKHSVKLQSLFLAWLTSPAVLAQTTCSAANAYVVTDQAAGSQVVDPSGCNGDPQCLAFLSDASSYLSAGNLDAIGSLSARAVIPRQTTQLTCSATEGCFSYQSILLCVDLNTGSFRDSTGGQGNLLTGAYTAGSGQSTTVANARTTSVATAIGSPSTGSSSTDTPSTSTATAASTPQAGSANRGLEINGVILIGNMMAMILLWGFLA